MDRCNAHDDPACPTCNAEKFPFKAIRAWLMAKTVSRLGYAIGLFGSGFVAAVIGTHGH